MVMILVQEKTKRARVGPLPGVTQDIAGFKVRNILGQRGSDYVVVACSIIAKIDCSHVVQTVEGKVIYEKFIWQCGIFFFFFVVRLK